MELERDRWQDFFRWLLCVTARHVATVEMLSGVGTDAWAVGRHGRRLRAIAYRPEEDVLEVAVGGAGAGRPALRFFVPGPQKITVTEHERSWKILIDDASGARTLVCLLDPLRAREVATRIAPAEHAPSRPHPALVHRRSRSQPAVRRPLRGPSCSAARR
jgi:hypothetical protein